MQEPSSRNQVWELWFGKPFYWSHGPLSWILEFRSSVLEGWDAGSLISDGCVCLHKMQWHKNCQVPWRVNKNSEEIWGPHFWSSHRSGRSSQLEGVGRGILTGKTVLSYYLIPTWGPQAGCTEWVVEGWGWGGHIPSFGRKRPPETDGTPNGKRPVALKKSIVLITVGFFYLRTFCSGWMKHCQHISAGYF